MDRKLWAGVLGAAALTITLAAVLQELEQPPEKRRWHGRVGYIPYDLRLPGIDRIREALWNPYDGRIFTRTAFGIGWSVNFHSLLKNLRVVVPCDISEEDYLMPTQSIRNVLKQHPTRIEV